MSLSGTRYGARFEQYVPDKTPFPTVVAARSALLYDQYVAEDCPPEPEAAPKLKILKQGMHKQ